MYHKNISRFVAIAILSAVGQAVFGQATRSPFTAGGIGDIIDLGQANNQGLGGLGISNGTYWHLNNINPALLPYNTLTVFSAGFVGQKSSITDGTNTDSFSGGNLNYLATAFPAKKGYWTTSFGLMPYSNVNYDFSYESTVTGSPSDTVVIREQGTGGFNQFYWSNGFAFNKHFSAGIKATYLFSSVEKKFSNTIQDVGNVYTPVVTDRVTVSDFKFMAGVAYTADSIISPKIRLNVGLTYDFAADINAKKLQSFDRTIANRPPIATDTLIDDRSGSIHIPHSIGFGVSMIKGYKWLVGMDFRMQNWSSYKDFNGVNNSLDDSYKFILGGEFTPDPTSVTNYWKRITFRLGGSYENTPYLIDNEGKSNQVKDFGINFGWSLPAGRYSSLDMAFRVGKRGDASKTIIEENYYRIYLGISFNDQWFIKRKYD